MFVVIVGWLDWSWDIGVLDNESLNKFISKLHNSVVMLENTH